MSLAAQGIVVLTVQITIGLLHLLLLLLFSSCCICCPASIDAAVLLIVQLGFCTCFWFAIAGSVPAALAMLF